MLNTIQDINSLSYKEYQQYARQIIIEEIKEEGQNRLKNAKIICIGAGGLNSCTMMHLAACGVGEIGIVDDDKIELSNLQRQVVYSHSDIGKKKAEAAQSNLLTLNKSIAIKSYSKKLTKKNIVRILSGYEIVIDGTDDFKTRYLISQYCYKLHKVHIYGAIEKFTGQVSIFNYQNSVNYYELLSQTSYNEMKKCGEIGIINTLAGITGLLQATEAIKIVIGIGKISCNQLIVFNLLDCSLNTLKVKPCRLVDMDQMANTVIVAQPDTSAPYVPMDYILNSQSKKYALIDIRTEVEFKLKHLSKAINMPLHKLKTRRGVKHIKDLANKYHIAIYCNRATRSYVASKILSNYSIEHCIIDNK